MDELSRKTAEMAEEFPTPDAFLAELERSDAPDDQRAVHYCEVGVQLHAQNRYNHALVVWRRSLEYCVKFGDRVGEARCRRNLGEAYRALGSNEEATESLNHAITIARELGDRSLEAGCLLNLGNVFLTTGRFAQAEKYYLAATEIAASIGEKCIEGKSHLSLAAIFSQQGQFQKAVEHSERSLVLMLEIGDKREQANCYAGLGMVYAKLKDFTRALENYERALALFREVGYKPGELVCIQNLGAICKDLNDFPKAICYFEQALKALENTGDRAALSRMYNNLGCVYDDIGDYRTAVRFYHQALEIKRAIGDRVGEYLVSGNMAESYASLGDFHQALELYGKALNICTELGNDFQRKDYLRDVGRIYFDQGNFGEAAEYCRQAAHALENIRDVSIPAEYRQNFWRDNVAIFDGLITSYVKIGKREEALQFSERGKGRAVADLMLAKGLTERQFNSSPLTYDEICELAQRIQRNLVLLRVTEEGSYVFTLTPGGRFDFLEIPDFDTERLGRLLVRFRKERPVDGWIYRYAAYKTIQEDARRVRPHEESLEREEVLKVAQGNWFRVVDDTLRDLHKGLLGKVFQQFPKGEKIVVVPNRALNVLPLHASFCDSEGQRRYLLEDYEITYAPNCSLLNLCHQRENETRRRDNLIAIANPVPPYDLTFSEWEVEEIAKFFTEDRKKTYVRQSAKQSLLESVSGFGVVHLSTHGLYDLGSNFNSRLSLGQGEDLTLDEIFSKIRLDQSWLVCLSACESGLTDYRDVADEYIGLQTAFLYAGAPTVIASLWTVDDFTTALVMIKTYEFIFREHLSKSEALRKAQLWLKELTAREVRDMLKEKELALRAATRMSWQDIAPLRSQVSLADPSAKPFAHPYYWAGFQVFGA